MYVTIRTLLYGTINNTPGHSGHKSGPELVFPELFYRLNVCILFLKIKIISLYWIKYSSLSLSGSTSFSPVFLLHTLKIVFYSFVQFGTILIVYYVNNYHNRVKMQMLCRHDHTDGMTMKKRKIIITIEICVVVAWLKMNRICGKHK